MEGMTLAYPWLLCGIPAAYLVLFSRRGKPFVPAFSDAGAIPGIPRSPRQYFRPWVLHGLFALFVVALFVGAARPQRIIMSEPEKHRNLILAVDVSPSMEAADIQDGFTRLSRMEAIKEVLKEFIAARRDDRIGLVVFGGRAFLQSPLTNDHEFLLRLVSTLEPGLAGDGTAIGDGLGLSLKRIRELPAETRAVILMTDGANNAGRVDPDTCAAIAKSLGIKIHTIGIGGEPADPDSGGLFGLLAPQADFDEALLKDIAAKTGGIYFNAGTVNKLREIYSTLDTLLSSEFRDDTGKITYEYYWIFSIVCLASLSAFGILTRGYFRRVGGPVL